MIYIRNSNGTIIGRSKNLNGIRRFASRYGIESLYLGGYADGTGILVVYFNGASATAYFASFEVMQQFVRNWRNARGAAVNINGVARGVVTSKEPAGYPACMEAL
jgi:hypothetical protein